MKLVRGAWKLLVAIKDGLVLVAMLLFFGMLFVALNARNRQGAIKDGALVLKLDGPIVEQTTPTPVFSVLGGTDPGKQYRLRDVVRALREAKTDDHVKTVVLDLDKFGGAYPATLGEVAAAIADVRNSGKKVLAYATGYSDGGYRIASAASEIWMDPQGGTLFAGPGGSQLYYKGLVDKIGANVHVYRVGKFKSAVEPYTRADESPEARAASEALYGGLFEQWRQSVARYRPKAQVASFLTNPAQTIAAAKGDIARANMTAGIVDQLGDRVAFGKRVAQLAGGDSDKAAGWYKAIDYDRYIDAHALPKKGAIGVITVSGEIVDGTSAGGNAGGDTISKAILGGLARRDLKAIVLRVDSPGGSVLASEKIRTALVEAKRRGLPVVVSMGGLAASGGYWISTPGDAIFAEPDTITGSIGIFGIIPTFEGTLAKLGVTADGVKTTPLSGQPDVYAGTNPEVDQVLQSTIEHGYGEFIARVAQSRHLTPQRVDEIGQGRVWIGGAARQLGLVDRFGTIDDAIAEAARRAKLSKDDATVVYLEKKPSAFAELVRKSLADKDDDGDAAMTSDVFGQIAWRNRQLVARAIGDVQRLMTGSSVRAECLECAGLGPVTARASDLTLFDLLRTKLGL